MRSWIKKGEIFVLKKDFPVYSNDCKRGKPIFRIYKAEDFANNSNVFPIWKNLWELRKYLLQKPKRYNRYRQGN